MEEKKEGIRGKVLRSEELIAYQKGSVVSRTLIQKKAGTITAFAFDEGESLSEHTAPFDALLSVLDGEAEVTVAEEKHRLTAGEMIILPADIPHALRALKPFRMLLSMIRSE